MWCKDALYTHVSGLFVNATISPSSSIPAVPRIDIARGSEDVRDMHGASIVQHVS